MSDEVKPTEPPKRKPPVLMGKNLLMEVVCKPPDDSPFSPVTVWLVPYTRREQGEYLSWLAPFAPAKDDPAEVQTTKDRNYESKQAELLAVRIRKWDVLLTEGGPTAEINPGTVAMLPPFCFNQIEDGLFGKAGVLMGNSVACSV